jgi:hypothetical protein
MRQRSVAGVMLACLVSLFVGCSSTPAASPPASPATVSCSGVKGAHHAWVVVQHLSGSVVEKCAGFDSESESGLDLMKASSIEYQTQHFSFGDAVCQIDNEPAQFSQCLPQNAPYWALFVYDGSAWKTPEVGVSDVKLTDMQALGWRYTQPSASPAPPPAPPR